MKRFTLPLRQGLYEIDSELGRVVFDGADHFLRHQSFQVLLYLLENRNRVITKEELHAEVWRDTAVTDNALVQCIAEIRRLFQDDARNPNFIKTVPKKGYRLVAPIVETTATPALADAEISVPAALEIAPHRTAAPATFLRSDMAVQQGWFVGSVAPKRMHAYQWAACIALLAVAAAGLFAMRGRVARHRTVQRATVAAPTSVLVQRFQNRTGRPDLDWLDDALPEMLADSMNHVPSLTARVADNKSAGMQPAAPSEKESNAAIITGDITMSGDSFVLEFTTRNQNNQILGKDQTKLTREELPLEANLLASVIAGQLGVVAKESTTALNDATTTNAEAFRYYRVGVERAREFKTAQAVEALTKAVSLDSKFAMAYARLGYAYAVTNFAPEKGQPYLDKAWMLSAHLPEKQRLYIAAWRAISKHQFQEAMAFLRTLTERYPQDDEAFVQLANLQRAQELPKESEATLEAGLRYSPQSRYLYNSLAGTELTLHQYPKALSAARHYVALAPDDPNALDTLGMIYQQTGSPYEALAEYSAALLLDPGFEPAMIHMGDSYYQVHRLPEAAEYYKRYISIATTDKARAIGYGNLSTVYRDSGQWEEATRAATEEHRYNPQAVWDLLVIAVNNKQEEQVRKLEKQLAIGIPTQERGTPGDLRTLAYERGWLALQHGNKEAAIASFQEALRHQPATSGIHSNDNWQSLANGTPLIQQPVKPLIHNAGAASSSPAS